MLKYRIWKLNLSAEEQSQKTSSETPIYESCTGWAVSWLCDAAHIARVKRGIYVITERGGANRWVRRMSMKGRQEVLFSKGL